MAQVFNEGMKTLQRHFCDLAQCGMLANLLNGMVERDSLLVSPVLQFTNGFGTDFAIGYVDNAEETYIIMRIGEETHVGQHIFDLSAFVEFAAPNDLVGDIQAEKLFFNRA